ncbi:hypothetical protein [Methylobacterium pseudosasicola]|uniref:hypothetical protein n=1 Tax=Methylobacterium pseudosasicola TaxID=582667 RepID=UPI0011138AE7|nr:hypothetical protein [Methylobacterium pseudosasicola]
MFERLLQLCGANISEMEMKKKAVFLCSGIGGDPELHCGCSSAGRFGGGRHWARAAPGGLRHPMIIPRRHRAQWSDPESRRALGA